MCECKRTLTYLRSSIALRTRSILTMRSRMRCSFIFSNGRMSLFPPLLSIGRPFFIISICKYVTKKKQFKQNTRESVYSLTNSDCVYGWLCLVTQNEELTNLLRWYKPSGTSVHYIGWTRLQINTQSDNLSFFIKTSFHDNTIHTEDVCSTFSNLPPLLKGGRDLLKFCSLAWSITIILPGLFPVDRKGYRY